MRNAEGRVSETTSSFIIQPSAFPFRPPRNQDRTAWSAFACDSAPFLCSDEKKTMNSIDAQTQTGQTTGSTLQSEINPPVFTDSYHVLTDSNGFNGFIFSVMARVPSHSSFANLGPKDHALLLEWLLHHKLEDVKKLLAKPRPDGFEINTSIMSLSRYKRRFFNDYLCELHEHDPRTFRPPPPPQTPAALKQATITSLRHQLFRISYSDADPFKIRALASAFEKIARQPINNP
jgi:hypothetical protein